MIQFTLSGAPRTKKNHGRRIWRGGRAFHVPSEAHEHWHKAACRQAWVIREELRQAGVELPICGDVHVRAIFYRDAKRGDLNGYMQSLGDWLEDVQIIRNDRQIVSWDGTRLEKDPERPRIEVEID